MGGKRGRRERMRLSASSQEVPREHLPSPGAGRQEPPTPARGLGSQAPPGRWGNAVTLLSRWTHSSSPVTSAGLWVSNGCQPTAELPGDGRARDKASPRPQQVARRPAGFGRSAGAGEDPPLQLGKGRFPRTSPPVSRRPSPHCYLLRVVSNTQYSPMELLGWSFFHGF